MQSSFICTDLDLKGNKKNFLKRSSQPNRGSRIEADFYDLQSLLSIYYPKLRTLEQPGINLVHI